MPKDKSGRFHLNTQRAMRADALGSRGDKPRESLPGSSRNATEVDGAGSKERGTEFEHNSADGTDGGHHEAVKAHLENMHAQHGGRHMHITEHEHGGMTSHHIGHDGQVEGPHDHENIEALKDHLGRFFNEEENEYTDNQHQEHGAGEPSEYA